MKRNNKGLDTCKEKIEILPYCPLEISKVYTKKGAMSRSFPICELSNVNKMNVHIRAYVDFYGGYATHGREILFGLGNSGECTVKLTPIKSLIDTDPSMLQECNSYVNNPSFEVKGSKYLCIAGPGWAQEQFNPDDGRYSIIWTMVESLNCHPMIKPWLSNMDELWLPTDCDIRRFSKLDIKDTTLVKMHLGYDDNLYNAHVLPMDISNLKGRFVFGVLGSWNKRKNIRKIVRAFCKSFKNTDNVSLMLISKYATRPYNGNKDGETVSKEDKEKWDLKYEFDRCVEEFDNMPHISLVDVPIHENVLPNLMKRFDCLVGFSMGESTWLPGLQAMRMEIPVIQLNSSCNGFMEYMHDDNSYLCKEAKYVEACDELVKGTSEYYEGQQFAEGDEDELSETMKRVYKDRNSKLMDDIINNAYNTVSQSWTWKKSVKKVIERLKQIGGIW